MVVQDSQGKAKSGHIHGHHLTAVAELKRERDPFTGSDLVRGQFLSAK